MSVSTTYFGKTKDGEDILLYTIKNERGMEASVTNFGAVLVTLLVPDKAGTVKDLVLGFDKGEDYLTNPCFFGATIGRSANRIAGAKFMIDGVTYRLKVNDNENNLHSDSDLGYHKRLWNAEPTGNGVKFSYLSPDGEMGFPGNLKISVTYTLTDDNALELFYEGISDKKTLINLTNHTYFNLSGHDAASILDTSVVLYASHYTPIVPGAIPTGEIAAVAGTPMDFTAAKTIGKEIDTDWEQLTMVNGYDHNFVLDNYDGTLRKIAETSADGRTMEVYTDLPGVQFYTGNGTQALIGKGGVVYGPRNAFCLETQFYPNSINQEGFRKPEFDAGERYRTKTVYRFV
ncbi:MAG: aldose epimerase family protein [Lachnospiraceae bacterium]